MRTKFETPDGENHPNNWEGGMAMVRLALDQIDELIEAIDAGKLTGIEAATHLQLATRTAESTASTSALFATEIDNESDFDPFIEKNLDFWQYALAQCEKARAAFESITPEQDERSLRIYNGQRGNIDRHTQFFRDVVATHNVWYASNTDLDPDLTLDDDDEDDLPDFRSSGDDDSPAKWKPRNPDGWKR